MKNTSIRQNVIKITDIEDGYYLIPKMLIKNKKYSALSLKSVMLYAFLRDLLEWNWQEDANGCLYVEATNRMIEQMLGCTKRPATKAVRELKNADLLEIVPQKPGLPNRLYLKKASA